ncbi:MAG: hypothetical protein J6V06_06890 [Clostridia bacterium]|nr:hypothetical protein [Clostridia bacterium]
MKIFAEVTEKIMSMLPEFADKSVLFDHKLCAENGDKNAILFRSDTAYELGGSGKIAVGSIIFSDLQAARDEVVLYGPDLDEITEDTCYAHLTFVRLKQKNDEELTYEQLKNIGFTAFQIYPEGFHIRISPSASKEQVRVAKTAIDSETPLSFLNVGCSLISAFKENDDVESVKTIYITKKDFDYRALSDLAMKVKKITDAVHSTLQLDELDCASCKMKPVCDEVEGLRELHFKKEREKY